MEIEFNPSRIPKAELAQPVVRSGSSAAAASVPSGPESVPASGSLLAALKDVPLVRSDKMQQARSQFAATNYPPVELLNRIAILLAVHLKH